MQLNQINVTGVFGYAMQYTRIKTYYLKDDN